nr:MAG TPA: hypothetical protein [Caudoviricetes sp.]
MSHPVVYGFPRYAKALSEIFNGHSRPAALGIDVRIWHLKRSFLFELLISSNYNYDIPKTNNCKGKYYPI